MNLEAGFDYSPYLGGVLSPQQCAALVGRGLTRPCIAMDSSDDTLNTCLNLVAAGVPASNGLDSYRELALSNPLGIDAAVSDTLAGFKRLAAQSVYIRRLWLTAEDTGAASGVLAESLARATGLLAGFNIGIYSGNWYWGVYLKDTAQFDGLPKWWAGYDGIGAVPPGYEGWQYQGNVTVAGAVVDLDVFNAA